VVVVVVVIVEEVFLVRDTIKTSSTTASADCHAELNDTEYLLSNHCHVITPTKTITRVRDVQSGFPCLWLRPHQWPPRVVPIRVCSVPFRSVLFCPVSTFFYSTCPYTRHRPPSGTSRGSSYVAASARRWSGPGVFGIAEDWVSKSCLHYVLAWQEHGNQTEKEKVDGDMRQVRG